MSSKMFNMVAAAVMAPVLYLSSGCADVAGTALRSVTGAVTQGAMGGAGQATGKIEGFIRDRMPGGKAPELKFYVVDPGRGGILAVAENVDGKAKVQKYAAPFESCKIGPINPDLSAAFQTVVVKPGETILVASAPGEKFVVTTPEKFVGNKVDLITQQCTAGKKDWEAPGQQPAPGVAPQAPANPAAPDPNRGRRPPKEKFSLETTDAPTSVFG